LGGLGDAFKQTGVKDPFNTGISVEDIFEKKSGGTPSVDIGGALENLGLDEDKIGRYRWEWANQKPNRYRQTG
jgi:hypothetical protein